MSKNTKRHLIVFGIFALACALTGCAYRAQNPKATLPPTSPEAVTRSITESANSILNIATRYYQDQKALCFTSELCRFSSPAALEGFRGRLVVINDLFTVTVKAIETYRANETPENQARMINAGTNLQTAIQGVKVP
jgi:hypothetical protein